MNRRVSSPRFRTSGMWVALGIGVLAAVTLGAAQGSGVTPTNLWMDIYGSHSTFAGIPIPAGAYVAVMDPQDTKCGERVVVTPGQISPVMPCYGDDMLTIGVDEGAMWNDLLRFSVGASMATPQPRAKNFSPVMPDTPVRWSALDVWEIDLYVPPHPLLDITHLPGATRLDWQPAEVAVDSYEVWRSEDPYFIPGDGQSEVLGTVATGAVPLQWLDSAGAGDPAVNYTYRVLSLNANSQMVGASQAVGEFDFALFH